MGHGAHWRSLLGGETSIEDMLRTLQKQGRPRASRDRIAEWVDTQPVREETIYTHDFPATPLRYLHLQVTDSSAAHSDEFTIPVGPIGLFAKAAARLGIGRPTRPLRLWTAYPFAVEGSARRVRVEQVQPWSNHVEGTLVGTAENGQMIAFFDTQFFLHAERYQAGETYEFQLSALAYSLECCNGETVELTNQDVLENYYRTRNENPPRDAAGLLPPATLSLQNLTTLFPGGVPNYPEDMLGRCRIQSVSTFHVEGTLVYRITPMPSEDGHPMPEIFAAEHVLKSGYRPQTGDSITGLLWMQGYLLRKASHAASP